MARSTSWRARQVLMGTALLFFCSFSLWAQNITVTGRVVGDTDEPMPGVSVVVKGTTTGTTTGIDGRYSLSAPGEATLVFSFVGYTSEEVALKGRTAVDISLVPDLQALSELVVVAYGTQKRTSLVSAVSSVTAREITALPVPSVEQAIQGRVPGLIVTNNGGPGSAPLVRLRGVSSINFASSPLYVVDGIPQVGAFENFDPRDIESLEVLRDANAAALYGSRATNGVILITTKKGSRDGKLRVTLDSYYGVQTAWRKLDLLNRDQYIQYGTALLTNSGGTIPSTFSTANQNQPTYAGSTQSFAQTNTNWQDEMFRSAAITQNSVSISGGNAVSRFYASAGYFQQQGIMLGTSFDRVNFRINSEHNISKVFTFGQTLFVSSSRRNNEPNAGGRAQLQNTIRMVPYIPVLNPTQVGGYGGTVVGDASDPQNPVRAALQDLNQDAAVRILGTVYLEAAILPWLKYRLNVGVDYTASRNYQYYPIYSEGANNRNPTQLSEGRGSFFSPVLTNQLTFDKTFGKHSINAIAAIEYQTSTSLGLSGSGTSATNTVKELNGLGNQSTNGFRDEAVIFSYIGRLNYEYAGKYLLSASLRRDGASQFAPGRKFGNFPSIGVGWRLSEEAFMKNISSISELKFRGSWGTMGFIPGNYLWQSVISQNAFAVIGGASPQGGFYNQLPNRDLAWELTNMTNVGVDLGLFRNKVTLSAEWYTRRSQNLILAVPLIPSQGFSQPTNANIGDMTNSGLEFVLGYNQNEGNFKWNVSANIATVSNRVNNLGVERGFIESGQNGDLGNFAITRTQAGQPVQSFYGWQTAGIFQNQSEIFGSDRRPVGAVQNLPLNDDGTVDLAQYNLLKNVGSFTRPGDIRFANLDGNTAIGSDDRTWQGSFLPNVIYGVNFSANYKNFDFTLFLQGVQGNKVFNATKVYTQGMLRLFNSGVEVLNAWRPDNTNTNIPRAVSGDPNSNSRTSDRFIEDGSYLRVKNVSVGYTVSTGALKSFAGGAIASARLYVSAQNLLTFTSYTGYDPEVGSRFGSQLTSGIDYGQFPAARTVLVGLQVGF